MTVDRLRSAAGTGTRAPVRSIVTMSALNVAQTACNAMIALLTTVALGPADRGVMVVGITVGSFLSFIGGLGTGPALRSRAPSADGEHRLALLSAYTWWSVAGAVLAPALAVAASAASAPAIDAGLADPGFLLALAVYTSTQLLMNQFVEAWYADGHYNRAVGSAAATGAASLAAVLVGLAVERTPGALLLAQSLGAAVACGVVGTRLHAAGLLDLRRPRLHLLPELLRVGTPALGVNAGLAVVLRADRYLLGLASGPAAVGVYSLAATLGEVVRVVPIAAGQVLQRETAVDRRGGGAARLLRTALVITAAGALVGGIAAWWLIPPVFGPEFTGARDLLVVLLVAEVCFVPYALASRGLLGGGWTGTAGSLGMAGAICAVACYAVATRTGGAAGAAVASLLVYGGLSAASWALLRRRLRTGRDPVRAGGPARRDRALLRSAPREDGRS
ncbi:lipopolysaccharide biosynthesis protein [Geodermatophilus sp. CPCC 206100]|uniref:lipopolysaccharide biosynthesis protein n=1 Tax=Geodermatophilus sp. CPCC 206100 TaxID=3020054 RepID=UPI003B00F805